MEYIIENGIILTMNQNNKIIKDGAVVVEDGRIVDVGKTSEIKLKYGYESINAEKNIVMPGLINTHVHLFQTLGKNLGVDVDLHKWFVRAWRPVAMYMSPDDYYNAAMLGIIEAIKSGTTTLLAYEHVLNVNDGHIEKVVHALKDGKIRSILGYGYQDTGRDIGAPTIAIRDTKTIYRNLRNAFLKYHRNDDMFKLWLAPGTINWCTEELLEITKQLADEFKTGITVHMNETRKEKEYSIKHRGGSEVEFAYRIGLLDRNVLGVHLVWVDEKEIELLAKTKTKVSHNPISNMYLASGIAPIPLMLKRNIVVSLATDGAASNNNMDMFDVIRVTPLLHKVATLNPEALSALDTLKMATILGARSIMMEKMIGSIEAGKKADIIIVDIHKENTTPFSDPISTLVYSGSSKNVHTVIVNGEILMREGRILYLDENKILSKAQKSFDKIREKIQEEKS
ncbi:MAG: amidohydrolase family protein [Candidatus Njordarchaeota archaeon]